MGSPLQTQGAMPLGPQNPRARVSIAPGEGWCAAAAGGPSHTHTFPQLSPVLESATSSRQPSHRYTRLSRAQLEVGLFRAPEGSGSAALLPAAQLPTFTLLVLPSSEAQARLVGRSPPTANHHSSESAASAPAQDHGRPIHALLPTNMGSPSPSSLPHPALLAPRSQLLALSGLLVLGDQPGARRYPESWSWQRTRVLLLWGVREARTPVSCRVSHQGKK